jgi:hypothetical protein
MIKVLSEEFLLDPALRKKLIQSFDSAANTRRKAEAFKGYECLKDSTDHYVYALLSAQFESETVYEMQYAISNISILRKVVEKLAKVYAGGVKRTVPNNDAATAQVEELAKLMRFNEQMAKANRYFRAFKNTLVFPKPVKDEFGKYALKLEILPPFKYDVIEDSDNPELPLAVVLSDYVPTRQSIFSISNPAVRGQNQTTRMVRESSASMPEQAAGEDARRFIWWTKNLHFTTNAKGEIISGPGIDNPIGELPFVNIAGDQDGEFWAKGGGDLIDAGVKINTMITNVRHVAVSQGYGQMYMTGKNLPKTIKVGPTHCIQIEQESTDDPKPEVGFLNSNPPIDELSRLIEMDVALMLSTNNLSTHGFSISLSGSKDFASGVAMMIDKAESVEDITEQSRIFVEREPRVWGKVEKWWKVFDERGLLSDVFKAAPVPKEAASVLLNFPDPKPVMSESEELDIIAKRRELGLNTEVELLMRDDPSLSEEQAQEKLTAIEAEKLGRMESAVATVTNGNQSQGNDGQQNQNSDDVGAPDSGPPAPGSSAS